MENISLKMDKNLLNNIDKTLKNHNYSTRTEFIRDSIRSKLTQLEKEEAIRKLEAFRGSLKGKAKMSYEKARKEAVKELFLSKGWDLKDLD
ncbi:MAG: ribbon-helix-helix domain-containing protein [Nanoarchaeota archaeon]|nr:ribbon-helix-helix domain-containing protein [Nanoarchaeota archaeon]MBU1321691.1 ribbon-helix-helix domain-containing protein [Nanoarchaeota archaeon]MBU1598068.1 ribbon-helix-helix domain-containing protein [Nanoarchaeota archaeon]MBU2441640.1 ribbon-helix-helix domain-containing protein [Nanoarchaeota archaeon]